MSALKKYDITIMLIGPPPIPKNDDNNPNTKPNKQPKRRLLASRGFIFFLFTMYISTNMVSRIIISDCIKPVLSPMLTSTEENIFFSAMPPIAEPRARAVPHRVFLQLTHSERLVKRETQAMANTVDPARKLFVSMPKGETRSITGLIIMPPPMPLIAPITEEMKLVAPKTKMACIEKSIYNLFKIPEHRMLKRL